MTASRRLVASDVLTAGLPREGPAGGTVLLGDPCARQVELLQSENGGIGLWEMGDGVVQHVEDDEVFLVLAGSGSVWFEDSESIQLRPGVLVRLHRGERATWSVTTPLRRLYVSL